MAQPPWKDAVARARRGGGQRAAADPALPAAALSPVDRLVAAAPGLQGLLDERRRLEERMQAITGQGPGDPRYAVEPLDRRRAALAAWSADRDAGRDGRRNSAAAFSPQAPPLRGTSADLLRGTSADQLRGTAADTLRRTAADLLRVTPGEQPADARAGRPAAASDDAPRRALGRLFDAGPEGRRARGKAGEDGPSLSDAGRSLGEVGRSLSDGGRAPDAQRRVVQPQAERQRSDGNPLDRRLARARDMAARARRTLDASERALDHARDAISSGWQERARERIPGLGRADRYVQEAAKKLQVLVGTLDEIGQKADRLRSLASDMRELKDADEANDEARRERALNRLKAKRQEN